MAASLRWVAWAAVLGLGWICTGCVEIHQVIHMQHDGSGRLVEKIRVLPRAVRMLQRQAAAGAQPTGTFTLLSEATLQERMKSYGQVELKERKEQILPDGSRVLEAEYTFKDINKVGLWVVPLFKANDPKRTGRLGLSYARLINVWGSDKLHTADQMKLHLPAPPGQVKYSSPATLKKFEELTSVFQDMLREMSLRIEVVSPEEDFEGRQIVNASHQGNRVEIFNLKGENVTASAEVIRQFITGEVGGPGNDWGGQWKTLEDSLPDTYTPYGYYNGVSFNFLKLAPVETPQKKDEKKAQP